MSKSSIDLAKLPLEAVEYWCPMEVVHILIAQQKGERYQYKVDEEHPFGHWEWFMVLCNGEYGIVSGLSMKAWLTKRVLEGAIESVNYNPEVTLMSAKLVMEYVKTQAK